MESGLGGGGWGWGVAFIMAANNCQFIRGPDQFNSNKGFVPKMSFKMCNLIAYILTEKLFRRYIFVCVGKFQNKRFSQRTNVCLIVRIHNEVFNEVKS